jgi:hypothetical protein
MLNHQGERWAFTDTPSTSFVNHNAGESGAFTGRFHPARKNRVELPGF